MKKNKDLPLIGFFPLTFNLAETGRAILVAKRYVEMGGKAIFFSHGGSYEHLIKEFGFEFIRVKPIFTDELVDHIVTVNRLEKKGIPYSLSFIEQAVKEELAAFKKTGIKMVVSFHNIACCISARVAGIPLIFVSPASGNFHLDIPDNYKTKISCIIPKFIRIPIFNFSYDHGTAFLEPFNIVSKKYGVKLFKSTIKLLYGDRTLATNFFEYINVFPNQQTLPKEDYVGIILLEELFSDRFPQENPKDIDEKIKKHLNSKQRTILLTMGSSGNKQIFLKIINVLDKLNYSTIVVYANILDEKNLPKVGKNIILLKFVPSIKQLHMDVDLSIIHGGQGTVYSSAYAGKPVIGMPMNPEQHLNLEKMVGHKTGLMMSRKFFKEQTLINNIQSIFNNYTFYLKNAQKLKNILPKPQGDLNTAKRLVELIDEL